MSELPATRAYRLAYDGRPFHGFQRQPDVSTVEECVFDALRDLGVLDDEADKPDGYAAAGRTDAGVSARAQTVAFEAPEWLSPRAFNSELPASVRAWASADVDAEFHATHDAVHREYRYHLYAPRDGSERASEEGPIDEARVRDALDRLAGEHDFHNLTPDVEGTVRELSAAVERDDDFLVVELAAGGFARQLVRRVVGLAVEVGRGESDPSKIDRVLGSDVVAGPEGVAPAPPYSLVLWDVAYPGVAFSTDRTAAESARAVWRRRHRDRTVDARVAGAIRDGIE
ncbi:tRNA pseudouridine(38-40) synthase TruA [Halosimplex litoreum]|uniref:tRNA pseudouridine synthase A n=1 Tax=Halosimplex litoreum TaxID=1198301 RepID=A0A7T3G194_9EURY|nr:tRNA pseudouridine(38-40) synthase TruA [Halosimplex litoreum]QPV64536.1 tRNA pseudouridine(38-40) synthase TruA [Halosimplex litoreum]